MRGLSFQKISTLQPVIECLNRAISARLNRGEEVLWLVPGGSAIEIAVEVSKQLPKQNIYNLAVTLSDERYGPSGHTGSNWQQLVDKGFMLDGAVQLPVLSGLSLQKTVSNFQHSLQMKLSSADYAIGFFGIGADGHIAGIKPNSPALNSPKLAVGYKWDDFTRITITPKVMEQLDEAVVFMTGKDKQSVIEQLANKDISAQEQPAQILKKLKKANVYNDYLSM